MMVFNTFADLQTGSISGLSVGDIVWLAGYYGQGDPGEGFFTLNYSASPPADNGGTTVNNTTAGYYFTRNIGQTDRYQIGWFGGRGTTDYTQSAIATANVTAFNNAVAACPIGGTLVWDCGALLINGAGLSWTKRVGFVCVTPADYVLANLANTVNAVHFTGLTNNIELAINVAGLSNNCNDAIVIEQLVSPARADFVVGCNPAGYGLRLGGIENAADIRYMATVNFSDTPNWSVPTNTHVRIEQSGGFGTNASRLWVDISGGGNGISMVAGVSDAGNITISGVIQGITGSPLNVTGARDLRVRDMHLEGNSGASIFQTCTSLQLEDVFALLQQLDINGCRSYRCKNVSGTLVIDATSSLGTDDGTRLAAGDGFACASTTHETLSGIGLDSNPTTLNGGAGSTKAGINLCPNKFIHLWSSGHTSPPDGFGGTHATWTYVNSAANCFPGNPFHEYGGATTSTSGVISDGPEYYPTAPFVVADAEWISFAAALWGNQAIKVYVFDGIQYNGIGTTGVGAWQVIRGSCLIPAGQTWKICFRQASAGNTVYVGALSWVRGTTSPKFFD